MAWYTCINHVRVVGKPLYNFRPALPPQQHAESCSSSAPKGKEMGGAEGGPLVLEAVRTDPMVAQGGLMAMSEGGLLLKRLAAETGGESTILTVLHL